MGRLSWVSTVWVSLFFLSRSFAFFFLHFATLFRSSVQPFRCNSNNFPRFCVVLFFILTFLFATQIHCPCPPLDLRLLLRRLTPPFHRRCLLHLSQHH